MKMFFSKKGKKIRAMFDYIMGLFLFCFSGKKNIRMKVIFINVLEWDNFVVATNGA